MKHTHETLSSWLDVYELEGAMVFKCNSASEINAVLEVYLDARPIGNQHSYNRAALHPVAIRLGESFNYVRQVGNRTWEVGGAATIQDVADTLRNQNQRLPNSGNYRQQTYIGALIGGTHGFGPNKPTMMDAVVNRKTVGPVVTQVTIESVPLASFRVTHCVCPLSDMKGQSSDSARSYAVFPYSGDDPICVVSEFRPLFGETGTLSASTSETWERGWSWWRLAFVRLAQRFQNRFPAVNRFAQRFIGLAKMKRWESITDPYDPDGGMYHPWPEADRGGEEGHLIYHSQRPTHQYHNTCLACLPEDTDDFIRLAIMHAGEKLAGFIGVRELGDTSSYPKALNADQTRNSIDFYWRPQDREFAEEHQRKMQASEYDVSLHPSKTV